MNTLTVNDEISHLFIRLYLYRVFDSVKHIQGVSRNLCTEM
jgi:hypothetical protein